MPQPSGGDLRRNLYDAPLPTPKAEAATLHARFTLGTVLVALLLTPLGAAGTVDEPEISDAPGDATCFGGGSNEWADIVAAWISDETADAFNVNIALAKWDDNLGAFTGFTIQFEHQGVQFGAVAAYIPAPFGNGWEYNNGFIDPETGELSDFQDAPGSFTPGTPAIISVTFAKSHFPHGEAMDHELRNFFGGSADLKMFIPTSIANEAVPVIPPRLEICDEVESSATYMFATGAHSMHEMGSMDAGSANATADGSANATTDDVAPLASPQSGGEGGNDTPGPGVALVIAGALVAVAASRRRA